MRLFIQIPCLNEEEHLPETVADLPREIDGITSIELLIIDDGSTDRTVAVARELGAHHILSFPHNRGLAFAHMNGIDACLRLGADIIVNTDADNQYCGEDIAKLVAPIVEGKADYVVGDRQTDKIAHFSPLKRFLQKLGSSVVRRVAGNNVLDTTSGFRAMSSRAARRLFVHNRFTYTLETVIQAGDARLTTANVAIRTNPMTRESRLFSSIPNYIRRNGLVIVRSYLMFQPLRTFVSLAIVFFFVGAGLVGRFLFFYIRDPSYSGYNQSLLIGVSSVVLAFVVAMMALLGDLLAANRRLLEDVLQRVRRVELQHAPGAGALDGVSSTAAKPWTRSEGQ